jgi:hypothetical protein
MQLTRIGAPSRRPKTSADRSTSSSALPGRARAFSRSRSRPVVMPTWATARLQGQPQVVGLALGATPGVPSGRRSSAGPGQLAGDDGRLAPAGDRRTGAEDLVVAGLDLRRGSPRTGGGRSARSGPRRAAAAPSPPRRDGTATWRGRSRRPAAGAPRPDLPGSQVGLGDPEAGEVLQRQVDPTSVEVLGDVPDEVGQLEGDAQVHGRPAGVRRGRLSTGSTIEPMTAADPCM